MHNDRPFAVIRGAHSSVKAITGSLTEFYSESDDRCIKFWRKRRDDEHYEVFHTFEDDRNLFTPSVAYSKDKSCCAFSSVMEFTEEDDPGLTWVESRVRIWHMKNQSFYRIACITDMNFVLSVCFLHNNDYIAYGCYDGSVNIFKKTTTRKGNVTFERHQTLRNLQRGVLAITFCDKKKLLIATSHDATAFVWLMQEDTRFKPIKSLLKHSKSVCGVAFSSSETCFATISSDGTFCVWECDTFQCIVFKQFNSALRCVVACPSKEAFICGTRDGSMIFWQKEHDGEVSLWKRSIDCIVFKTIV